MDQTLELLAEYVLAKHSFSKKALETAVLALGDSLSCALLALNFPACTKYLGPIVEGTVVPGGARIPGTPFVLDPVQAAFNFGTMIRWLDYNDTWLALEWGHPSDNLGALLPLADYLGLKMETLLVALIKAYEIQGVLALSNSFNRIGFDHVILVKIAIAATATALLGGTKKEVISALSNAFIDAGPLRTYRHYPNTGERKSWAAGDAAARGVQLAFMAMRGEKGYETALSAPLWGFNEVLFPVTLTQPLGCYVMENILFKVAFPAEFHAATAVEAAFQLHNQVKRRIEDIERIEIRTNESAKRIIDKEGPLKNPADRDHCLQYMVAVALLEGELQAKHYEEEAAKDPRIDILRRKMRVIEHPPFTKDYLDPTKRSIANALSIYFTDGTHTDWVEVHYPLGHTRRREEAIPLLHQKFLTNVETRFSAEKAKTLLDLLQERKKLEAMNVKNFVDLWIN